VATKRKTPKPSAVPAPVAPSGRQPFTRLEHHSRATTEEFEREHMGIAAKE
jgi:hypothetical protein